MRNIISLALLCMLLGFGNSLHSQDSRFFVKTNILTLPQPNLTVELEFQPVPNLGLIIGASTKDGFVDPGNLAWFRKKDTRCKVQTFALLGGGAYFYPFNLRWEFGGKLLYQYIRTFIPDVTCIAEYPNHPTDTFVYAVNSHSINLMPSARFSINTRLFLEPSIGLGLDRSKLNTGKYSNWYTYFPAQLNFGIRF